jgi:tRNA U38,U39,U40 pseudouridine synthase TruA
MIRLMVGTLIDVGRGHLPPGTVRAALEAAGQDEGFRIGECVPGKGLCLEKVRFS